MVGGKQATIFFGDPLVHSEVWEILANGKVEQDRLTPRPGVNPEARAEIVTAEKIGPDWANVKTDPEGAVVGGRDRGIAKGHGGLGVRG